MRLEKLIAVQEELAKKVVLRDEFEEIKSVAGVDMAYRGSEAYCAAVVLDYDSMAPVEEKVVKTKVDFPYVPTFLAFRELAPIKKALRALRSDFQIVLVDGHGIAHPRGIGIASHLGVTLSLAAIGVAKSLLCGDVKSAQNKLSPVIYNNRKVGFALKTDFKPIYISPGHRVSLKSSLKIVKRCLRNHRLPEPTRLAHILAARAKAGGEHKCAGSRHLSLS